MATIQSSTDKRFKPEMSLRERLAGIVSGITSQLPASMQSYPDVPQLGVQKGELADDLMTPVTNLPGIAQAVSTEDLGQAIKDKSWLGAGLAGLGMMPGGRAEAKVAEGAIDAGRDTLARLTHPSGAPIRPTPEGVDLRLPKGLTKEQAKQAAVMPETTLRTPEPKPDVQGAGFSTYKPRFLENVRLPSRPQFDLPRFEGATPSGRVTDMLNDPKVQEKVWNAIQQGKEMGGSDWYVTDPLLQRYIQQFGPDLGHKMHQRDMMMTAATSPQHQVEQNIPVASEYSRVATQNPEKQIQRGDPITPGYGHYVQKLHQDYAGDVQSPGFINSVTQPKPPSFGSNLVGNYRPVAVDIHATRLPAMASGDPRWLTKQGRESGLSAEELQGEPTLWDDKPNAFTEYPFMEKFYQRMAADAGMDPAQAQANAWLGAGAQTGLGTGTAKPYLGMYEDAAETTAKWLGMDPQDVINQVIRGERAFETETGYKAKTGKKPPKK